MDVCFCVFEINVCQTVHLREKYIQILEDRETLGLIMCFCGIIINYWRTVIFAEINFLGVTFGLGRSSYNFH